MKKLKIGDMIISAMKYIVLLGIVFLQYYQFQFVTMGSTSKIFTQNPVYFVVNILILLFVNFLISIFIQKWSITLAITGIIATIWSIAHHYVVILHGTPLFFSTLVNAGTAMKVLSSYTFELDVVVIRLLLCFCMQVMGIALMWFLDKKNKLEVKRQRYLRGSIVVIIAICLYVSLFSPASVGPERIRTWKFAVNYYGFFVSAIEDFQNYLDRFMIPEGYSSDSITVESSEITAAEGIRPDVILILNETFYDLDLYTDIAPSEDYFLKFYQTENAVTGHAVISGMGGATNNSEYELLTSNSMYLLNNETPYNYIDLADTNNNAVQYFEALGYSTYGFHIGDASNYSRQRAYPELGFDNIFLGNDFYENETYGNRMGLDAAEYKRLIGKDEEDGSTPKFMFLLTYQNHGGWDQNDDSYDTVVTTKDFGDLTDDINEYITSVSLSVEAFGELTDYYSQVDKPVVICMVGDHAPSFISQLSTELSSEEQELYSRLVPYVLWTNYDAELPENVDYISITDLVPMIAQVANLPLTAYYETILDLQKGIPVRTSYGQYFDNKLNNILVENDSEIGDLLEQYYYMEYNCLAAGEEYRSELFSLSLE